MTATTATATTATIAAELGTTPRELRKFLRSQEMGVGKGSRYALPATKTALTKMKKQFTTWSEAKAAEKATKEQGAINDVGVDSDSALDEVLDADIIDEEHDDASYEDEVQNIND